MVLGIVFLYLFNTFPCFHLHQNMIFPIREGGPNLLSVFSPGGGGTKSAKGDQICLAYLVRGDQIRGGGGGGESAITPALPAAKSGGSC